MKKQIFKRDSVLLAFTFISAFASAVFYANRISYVFVNTAVFSGFAELLLTLSVISSIGLLVLYILKAYNIKVREKPCSDRGVFLFFAVLFEIAAVLFTVADIAFTIGAGAETSPVILKMILKTLPVFVSFCAAAFLLFIFPKIKKDVFKKIIAAVISLGILTGAFYILFPFFNYKIVSDPMVIDAGDTYSVVFATNAKGTGYVEYTYEGEDYKLYDEAAGRIKGSSKIHTVKVPKEHLTNNSYKIGSARVIEELSYGGRSGKTVESEEYNFKVNTGSTQTFLTISDWHTRLQKAYDAVSYTGAYDGVILLGDGVPGLMFDDEIIDYIIRFGGAVTGGEKPVIYVRGNHETRGGMAAELPGILGLDSMYYTLSSGDYEFIVLDSGEDKKDDHPEYGSMVNYEEYRKSMISWLDNIAEEYEDLYANKKCIALVHSSDICIEEDLKERGFSALNKLNASQIISGHTHTCEFFEENGINIYLDGGHNNGVFTASKLTLNEKGYILEAWNDSGEKVFEKALSWK